MKEKITSRRFVEPDAQTNQNMIQYGLREVNCKPLSEMTLEELWQLFPIILAEHTPDWQSYYEAEKELLRKQSMRKRSPGAIPPRNKI